MVFHFKKLFQSFFTSIKLYRLTSHKSLAPISVLMYQPLNGAAVNSNPPQSNTMFETAGTAYHFKLSLANHSYL